MASHFNIVRCSRSGIQVLEKAPRERNGRNPAEQGSRKRKEFACSVRPVLVDILDASLEDVEACVKLVLRDVERRDVSDVRLAAWQEHETLLECHVGDQVSALGRVLLALPVLDELVSEHHSKTAGVAYHLVFLLHLLEPLLHVPADLRGPVEELLVLGYSQ